MNYNINYNNITNNKTYYKNYNEFQQLIKIIQNFISQKEALEKEKKLFLKTKAETEYKLKEEKIKLINEKSLFGKEKLKFENEKKNFYENKNKIENNLMKEKKQLEKEKLDFQNIQNDFYSKQQNYNTNNNKEEYNYYDKYNMNENSLNKNNIENDNNYLSKKRNGSNINKEDYYSDAIHYPKGLKNYGYNCYMNSLLQCLFYIQEFRNYFINNEYNFKENEQPLCKGLSEVMIGLKNDYNNYFEPKNFQKIIEKKNNLFAEFKPADTKDLFFNIIDSILNELLIEEKALSVRSNLNGELNINEIQMFNELQKENDQNNIINKLFLGYYENIYKCKNGNCIFSFNTDAFILFNLEQISRYYNNNQLELENCFEYNFNRRYNTSFYCSICKKNETNIAEDKIYRPPKILVLILDRGKAKSFKGNVTFHISLDLKNIIEEKKRNYSSKYKLISFIIHSGPSNLSGHYTTYCLTDNGKYFYFNDENVTEIQGNINYIGDPYLLFYMREDEDNYMYNIE